MPFLTAEWRYLAMLNYEVDPAVLARDVPAGTELDFHEGKTFVSLVGFRFLKTRLLGLTIPLHSNFDEVNLRFYVRRREPGGVKRGTVFIREIVPRRAIAQVARMAYNEKYIALPMSHRIELAAAGGNPGLVEYGWKLGSAWNHLRVQCAGLDPVALRDGSHEQFIAEHYWGYSVQRDGGTVEYRVEHPPWRIWPGEQADVQVDSGPLYGERFRIALSAPPVSTFVAEGSPVKVFRPRRLVV